MKKNCFIPILALITVISLNGTAFAAGWQQDSVGWKYEKSDGNEIKNTWEWIDGDQDGSAECYYFASDGYMIADCITPDGYCVGTDGAWEIDGEIQRKRLSDFKRAPSSQEIYNYLERRDTDWTSLFIDKTRPEVTSGATNIYLKKVVSNEQDTFFNNGWVWQLYKTVGSTRFYCPLAFDEDGYLLVNTITPDGYYVDEYGILNIDGQQVYHSDLCSTFPHYLDIVDKAGNVIPDKNNCDLSNIDIHSQMFTMINSHRSHIPWGKLVYSHCFYTGTDGGIHTGLGFGDICVADEYRPGR